MIRLMIDCVLFNVSPQTFTFYSYGDVTFAGIEAYIQRLWRLGFGDLYCVTSTVTRGLGFDYLIQSTTGLDTLRNNQGIL